MTSTPTPPTSVTPTIDIRPIQYRDLDEIESLLQANAFTAKSPSDELDLALDLDRIRHHYGLLKLLSLFPNPYRNLLRAYIAQCDRRLLGAIQVSPVNRTSTTWRVDRAIADPAAGSQDTGTVLLRHCLEAIWEARTWIVEVQVSDNPAMALYRQNGFQPLAQMTYWTIEPELLAQLGEREPDLPNLTPVSNSDAQLLYQLDTVSMPPLVRQVFDRHILDFKTSLFESILAGIKQWFGRTEVVSGYVFEPQRKAAIGYFQIRLSRDGSSHHEAQLTVHPAYTWLYPELLAQMARITQQLPPPIPTPGLNRLSTGTGGISHQHRRRTHRQHPVNVPFRLAQTAGNQTSRPRWLTTVRCLRGAYNPLANRFLGAWFGPINRRNR